jgi:PhnB protein
MQIHPYLVFNRQCEEAFKFYEKLLRGNITFMMTFGDSPMGAETPAADRSLIMHATISLDGGLLMASDAPAGRYEKPQGIHVSIHVSDNAEGERVFQGLAEGGNIQMPFQKTFWSPGFGMCVDRFGIPWMVNCEGPQPEG